MKKAPELGRLVLAPGLFFCTMTFGLTQVVVFVKVEDVPFDFL